MSLSKKIKQLTNAVTFLNTGSLALGASAGTQTYIGGITATAPSASTVKGTINTTNSAMVFGPVTLGANTTLNSNATTNAGDISLGAVTLGSYTLTVQTGNGISGADLSGTSVSGAGTLALQNIGGTVSFTGAMSPATLTVPNTVVNVALTGSSGTVTNAMTFANTGTLVLGQAGGTQTYTGGLVVNSPSSVSVYGTLATTNNTLTLGSVTTLAADTILSSGSGAVNLNNTVNGGYCHSVSFP